MGISDFIFAFAWRSNWRSNASKNCEWVYTVGSRENQMETPVRIVGLHSRLLTTPLFLLSSS